MPGQSRKRVFVLSGPSRAPKMEFVRQLFPLGAVLELNHAGVDCVCLSGFDATVCRCLLWDDAAPKLVRMNKKVFEHPACWLDLGHSVMDQLWVNVVRND